MGLIKIEFNSKLNAFTPEEMKIFKKYVYNIPTQKLKIMFWREVLKLLSQRNRLVSNNT